MQQYAPQESGGLQPAREGFAPLPLRARGTLELLDASIKLYRQYFGVLMAWSALVSFASVVAALVPGGSLLGVLMTPLLLGAVVCCVAASVRGQRVSFSQCWDFTKPRYGPLIGAYLLSVVVAIGLIFLIGIGFALLIGVGVSVLSSEAGGVVGLLLGLVLLVFGTIVFTRLMIWMGMVPVVVSMEEDKRSSSALSRANELLKGHYGRITGLMVLLGLGYLVLAGIFIGIAGMLTGVDQLRALANGGRDSTAMIAAIAGFGTSITLLSMLTTPLFYLIIALFYLDVRVRKEALDLEWSAHVTAPAAPQDQPYGAPATGFAPSQNTVPSAPPNLAYPQNPAYPPNAAYPQPYAPDQAAYPQAAYPPSAPPYPNAAPIEAVTGAAPVAPAYPPNPMDAPPQMPQSAMPAPYTPMETTTMDAPPATHDLTAPTFPAPVQTAFDPAPPFSQPAPFADTVPLNTTPLEVSSAPQAPVGETPALELTCANCGAKAPRGQRFCMQCGSNLPAA